MTQEYTLRNDMSIAEVLEYQGRLYHVPGKERRERADVLMDMTGSYNHKDKLIRHLSGGMKRKVMLLNGMVFASLGIMAAVLSRTHAGISRFSSFVLTPMSFLSNTFFSMEAMPRGMGRMIQTLPLTQTAGGLRSVNWESTCQLWRVGILVLYKGYRKIHGRPGADPSAARDRCHQGLPLPLQSRQS